MSKIEVEHRVRLHFYHSSLRRSLFRMDEAYKKDDNSLIFSAVGEVLLWLNNIDEWHGKLRGKNYKRLRKKDSNGCIIPGLRHAFNMLKHNVDFMQLHTKNKNIDDNSPIVWLRSGTLLVGKHKSQKQNYDRFIEGREIFTTIQQACLFLNKEYQRVQIIQRRTTI